MKIDDIKITKNRLIGVGILCVLIAIFSAWLFCLLSDTYAFACIVQLAVFGIAAIACFIIVTEKY